MILALAVSVNLRAAIVSFGTFSTLMSSVTVPTTTTVLFLKIFLNLCQNYCLAPRCFTRREIETGGLLTLEATSLLRMVLAKADSVLLTRNLKSYRKDLEDGRYLDE